MNEQCFWLTWCHHDGIYLDALSLALNLMSIEAYWRGLDA